MISEGDKEIQRLVRRGKTNISLLNQPNQKRPGYTGVWYSKRMFIRVSKFNIENRQAWKPYGNKMHLLL